MSKFWGKSVLLNLLYDYREDIPSKTERTLRKIINQHLQEYESAEKITEELTVQRKLIVEPLVSILSNPSELLRMGEVIRLLVDLKNEATRALMKIYSETGYATKEFIKSEIFKIPEAKKLALIPFAGSFKNKDIQQLVIELLNSLSDKKNLRNMVETLIERGNCTLELKVFCRLKGINKALIQELEALQSEVRWKALCYLENFTGDDLVIKAIYKRLKDPGKRIRQRALLILGNLEEGYNHEPLILALDDSDEDVQICALRMLVRRNYPDIVTMLIKMSAKSKNLKAIALSELAQISPHDYTNVINRMSPAQQKDLRAKLEEFNLEIFDTLKKELRDIDVNKRLKAAHAIKVIGLPVKIDDEYLSTLTDPDERVRATLVKTIGVAGNTMAISAILESLLDPDRRVRANAIETYAVMKDSNIIKHLEAFLQDPDNRVRGNAVKVLIELGSDSAFAALLDMLKSSQELMRLSALWVIEEIKEIRAKDLIAKISLLDQSSTVRERALKTLEILKVTERK